MIVGFFIGFGVMIYIMVKRAQGPDEEEPQDKENNQKKE
jgi:F0F1-type ATP synthase assembly protein I